MDGEEEGQATFDVEKALNYLKSNLLPQYGQGQCSPHMHKALIEGGLDGLNNISVQAGGEYGPILESQGFYEEKSAIFPSIIGDIAVIQGYPSGTMCTDGPCGHIQMYDGEHWISDFEQPRQFWPSKTYQDNNPTFKIYRWGGIYN